MGMLGRLLGRAGGMADDGAGALRARFGLSETTPPDIAQRIGAFRSADARGMSGGLNSGAASFHMQKEMLALQLADSNPAAAQAVRAAQTPEELASIVQQIGPAPAPPMRDPRAAQLGMVDHTPPDILDRVSAMRRNAQYGG
jgi:hypothetical protein